MCLCVCGEGSEREHLSAVAPTTLFTLFRISSPGWRGLVNFSGNSIIPDEDKRRTNVFLGQEETLSTPPPKRKEEAESAQGCADSPRV